MHFNVFITYVLNLKVEFNYLNLRFQHSEDKRVSAKGYTQKAQGSREGEGEMVYTEGAG